MELIKFWIWFFYGLGLLVYVGIFRTKTFTYRELIWFVLGYIFAYLNY